jgi:hypothetical protein
MSPPYDHMDLVTFGGTIGPPPGNWIPANPFTTVTTIDANDNVSNKMVGNLHHARWFPSGVLLPDGKIVAVGGGDKDEVVDPGTEIAVKVAEMYDPSTGQWTEVASHARDRTYHNSALLLPDMRLLLGGHAPIAAHYGGPQTDQGPPFANNDKDASFEVWSPPYLFRGPRPSIRHVQPGINWGETFTINTPNADEIESVLLMRTPTPQHVNDSDQRGLILPFTKAGPGMLKATAPPSGKIAPPGAYYLVVNKRTPQGPVPSVARIVKMGESITYGEALQPFADDNPAAPRGGSATPDEDTSNAASTSQRASEAVKAAPAPVGTPAAAATQTAYQAYTELRAVPASSTKPFSPVLPAAAIGAVGVAVVTGRRWLLSRI